MSAIRKRAQRATYYLIAMLMGLSLFAPIVALGNDDLVAGETATISTGGGDATIRASASSSAETLGSIPDGTDVYIIDGPISDIDGSLWYQAGVWDITGYINSTLLQGEGIDSSAPADAIEADEEAAPAEEASAPVIPWEQPIDYGVVVDNAIASLPGDGLACRVDAAGAAEVIVRFAQGQSVEVTGSELWSEGVAFLPVNCGGQGGFVKADYVALSSERESEPAADEAEEPAVTEEAETDVEVVTEEAVVEESATEEPVTDVPAAGDLIIRVSDGNESPVSGLCFQLYAAGAWVAEACDSNDAIPNNGNSGFFGIAPGAYTLVASSVPDGAVVDNREVSILAGDTGGVAIAVSVASEAEEPVVTDEPVATEEAVAAEEIAVTEDVVVTEEPVVTEEIVVTEEPLVTEEVVTTEEVVVTEEPLVTEEAVVTEEVVVTDEAVVTEETVVTEEPAATEEVVVASEPTATVEPEATEEPVATDEPAVVQASVATDEPDVSEEPVATDATSLDVSQPIGDATVTGTNGEGVRCRVAPDATSATIMVLAEGATVFVLEAPANGYIGVACGDQLGYADVNYMWAGGAGDEIPASANSVVVVGTGGQSLNCRSGAGSNFSVITSVPQGSVLTSRGASSNGWAPVVCNGMNGFVSIAFVEVSGSGSGTGTQNTGTGGTTGTGTISNTGGDGLRCRTAPNGSVIMVLAEGTRVTTRGAASNGWVPIVCGGMNGFVSASYITLGSGTGTTNPTPTPAPGGSNGGATSGYVKVTGTGGASLNCRSAASMTGMVITAVPANTTLAVRGAATNGWQPVTCAGRSGYVSSAYVSATTDPGTSTPAPSPTTPGAGSGQTGTATVANTGGSRLYCRTAPGGSAITIVPEGTTVGTRGASSNGWTPVICGGRDGYMSSQYLSTSGGSTAPAPTPAPGTGSAMKSGDNGKVNVRANMRYSASMSANVVVIVEAGEVLRITGNATNGFYPVSYDGLNGFMATELLTKTSEPLSERGGSGSEPDPQPAPGGGGTATGNAIVNYAMRYVGYPYVWATRGPSSFDCSGFTYWVIKNVVGKDIGSGLWTQTSAGASVSRSNLQPGDLVFFQNTYKSGLSHVGIYIGNNQFVHAENQNTGVRVSDLNSTYYGSRWYGAVRIT